MKPALEPADTVFLILALIGVAIVCLVNTAGMPVITDDAFIVLVYARHLVEGRGLIWNDQPVEGFTSFLDLIVKSIGTALFDDPVQMAFAVTLTFQVGCAGLVMFLAFKLNHIAGTPPRARVAWAAFAGFAVATSDALAYGAGFLLETPMFVLFGVLLSTMLLSSSPTKRHLMGFGFAAAALALTRPEGVVIGLVALLIYAYEHRRVVSTGGLLIPAGLFAGTVGALMSFRRFYFGYWAPNTYYAKSSSSRWTEIEDGVLYLAQASDSFYGIVLLVMATFGWTLLAPDWWKSRSARRVARVGALMAAAAVLTTILGGGDSYEDTRFVALPFTLATVLVIVGIVGLNGIRRAVAINVLAALTLVQCVGMYDRFESSTKRMSRWPHDLSFYHCDRLFAQWLANTAPDLDIAQSDFQRLKFFADSLRVVDLRGLNDETIAHLERTDSVRWGKFDHDLAVEVNAPIWFWGRRPYTREPMAKHAMESLLSERELVDYFTDWPDLPIPALTAAGRRMLDNYVPASVRVCQGYYNFLTREDLAARLRASGAQVGESRLDKPLKDADV